MYTTIFLIQNTSWEMFGEDIYEEYKLRTGKEYQNDRSDPMMIKILQDNSLIGDQYILVRFLSIFSKYYTIHDNIVSETVTIDVAAYRLDEIKKVLSSSRDEDVISEIERITFMSLSSEIFYH